MSNRSDAIAFLSLINQQRQVRQLGVLKEKADEANFIQRGIAHEARRQTSLERQQLVKEARLEVIRQKVFEAKKETERMKAMLGSPENAPHSWADFTAFRVRLLGLLLQSEGVAVENVPEYDDKERVDAMYADLGRVYEMAVARISPERLEQMELAFQYGRDLWRLRRLLELETEWPRVQSIRAALDPLFLKRHEIDCERANVQSRTFFALGFGSGRAKQLNEQSLRLREEILKLESQDTNITEDELRELRQQFGQHDLEELKSMVEQRSTLIDSFQIAVPYEEREVFDGSPGNDKGSQPALLPLPRGAVFVIKGDTGQKYDSLDDYAHHLSPAEVYLGAMTIQDAIEQQLARGVVVAIQQAPNELTVYSRFIPAPLSNEQFHHLLRRLQFVDNLTFTTAWAKDLRAKPVRLEFREVFDGFGRF